MNRKRLKFTSYKLLSFLGAGSLALMLEVWEA